MTEYFYPKRLVVGDRSMPLPLQFYPFKGISCEKESMVNSLEAWVKKELGIDAEYVGVQDGKVILKVLVGNDKS